MNSFALVLLLTLSAAAIASSKYVHGHQRRQHDYPQGFDRDTLCQIGLLSCAGEIVEKYHFDEDPQVALGAVSAAGARQACSEVLDVKTCVLSNINDDTCEGMPSDVRTQIHGGLDLVNFLCVERFDDLKANWDCFTTPSPAEEEKIQQCVFTPRKGRCDIKPVLDCMVGVLNTIPSCTSTAGDLFVKTFYKILPFASVPQCPGVSIEFLSKNVANVLQQVFKRK